MLTFVNVGLNYLCIDVFIMRCYVLQQKSVISENVNCEMYPKKVFKLGINSK